MEYLPFALFALLPLGLASLFSLRLPRSTAGFGFLAALAPVVASGISSLIGHKKQKASAKAAEEQRRIEAERADAEAKRQWESAQQTPSEQARRFKSKFAYGKLAGAMGGLEKVPKSLIDYYKGGYTIPEYTGTSSYVPTVQPKSGLWDFLGGVTNALGQFDYGGYKAGRAQNQALRSAGNLAAGSNLSLAPGSTGPATSIADLTRRIAEQTTQQRQTNPGQGITLSSGQTINPFDPKFRRF